MVAVAQGNHVGVTGVKTRHHHGEVVGFGTGVDEVGDLQITGHLRGQLFSELDDVRVQINGGGMLQGFVLLVGCGDDVRMAVADRDRHDAAEGVEIATAVFVEHVLAFAFDDGHRLLVVDENAGVEHLFAAAQEFISARASIFLWSVVKRRQSGCLHKFSYFKFQISKTADYKGLVFYS